MPMPIVHHLEAPGKVPTLELLIVDDGSTDGSVTAAREAGRGAETRVRIVASKTEAGQRASLREQSALGPGECRNNDRHFAGPPPRGENLGLVRALQTGLALARSPLIARMDADDIASPGRLHKQLELMLRSKFEGSGGLSVVGGAITIFHDPGPTSAVQQATPADGRKANISSPSFIPVPPQLNGGRATVSSPFCVSSSVIHPLEPLLVRWALWFSCCVAHPTTLLCATAVKRVGGYREEAAGAEDYDLWLRLANEIFDEGSEGGSVGGGGLANLPCVVLHHRRHERNVTTTGLASSALMVAAGDGSRSSSGIVDSDLAPAEPAAQRVARLAMSTVLGRPVTEAHVMTMRDPQTGGSVDDFSGAVGLLLELEEVTLGGHLKAVSFESPAARKIVNADATNRIAELAVTAMSRHASDAIAIWQIWAKRSNDGQQGQIAMLKGILS